MNRYREMQKRHQEEVNGYLSKFGFFAFNDDQFTEGMARIGLNADDLDKITRIPAGGYMLREKAAEFVAMLKSHKTERETAARDPEFAFDMFYAALCDYEYSWTGDAGEALDALGIDSATLSGSPELAAALERAEAAVMADAI